MSRLLSGLTQHPLDINSGSALMRAELQCAYVTPFRPSGRLVRNGKTAASEGVYLKIFRNGRYAAAGNLSKRR